jgi:hypothetical protein
MTGHFLKTSLFGYGAAALFSSSGIYQKCSLTFPCEFSTIIWNSSHIFLCICSSAHCREEWTI